MNKTAIKNFAVWARKKLIADIRYRAGLLGITEKGIQEALPQSGGGVEFYDIGMTKPYAVSGAAVKQRASLVEAIRKKERESDYKTAYQFIVEEVAYTWFNRLIAVRFMEVNDYLSSHLRVLSSESGKAEPDLVSRPFDSDLTFSEQERAEIVRMQQENAVDELFRLLFIKQCNALHEVLPALFETTRDYTEFLLSLSVIDRDGVVYHLVNDIPEEDFDVNRGGQVEIIGWLYQYYISEKHEEVVDPLHGKVIKKEDIPAATQLFTTDWVVRYMVDNSLGRYWIERHPESTLAQNLQYFVCPKSGEIAYVQENAPCKPQELTLFDPCMGSGHILVYAFEVLMLIYRECGYGERDAAREIVENNLYGLDIDRRAFQLSYFSIMMKARQYDRRFLSRGIYPQVYSPIDDTELTEYGSMVQVSVLEEKPTQDASAPLLGQDTEIELNDWDVRRLLAKTYKAVCTNPPYLNKYNAKLKAFVNENYKDYAGDLFSVFIYRNLLFCEPGGYCGYMSPFVWMFIKTYEKLRTQIIQSKALTTLVQMEYSAFEEATVPVCTFVLQNKKAKHAALCFRLTDFKGGMEVQRQKVLEAIQNQNCGYFYEAQQANFAKIPGSPIAYWFSKKALQAFEAKRLSYEYQARNGITTGQNDLFIRCWHEIIPNKLKWVKCNKGGPFRRWYGNLDYLIDWENDGFRLKNFKDENGKPKSTLRSIEFNFKQAITMSRIGSGTTSFRYLPEGFITEGASNNIYFEQGGQNLLAFLNSKSCEYILNLYNPTINVMPDDLRNLPLTYETYNLNLSTIINECIEICHIDWDSYETSWDFKKHPLI